MEQIREEPKLSERERTVLLLAADGLTDKEIANNLGLSLKTIHTYWDRMRQKFSASTRTQVFAKFLRIEVAPGTAGDLDRLFATWEEGVWVIGIDGKTIYANQRIAETYGYTHEELMTLPLVEVVGPQHRERIGQLLAACQAETFEQFFQSKSGARLWLHITATPWSDERGRRKAIVLLVRNNTLMKRVERALDSCAIALDGIMEVSGDCICKFDSNLAVVHVNPAFLRKSGCELEHVVGKHLSELVDYFHPYEAWNTALRQALETGERQMLEAQLCQREARSWIVPEPSPEFLPLTLFSVSIT